MRRDWPAHVTQHHISMTLGTPPDLAEVETAAQRLLEGEAAWRERVLAQFRNRCDALELRPAANWWAAIRFYLNLVDARALMNAPQASYRTDLFGLFLRQLRRQITYEDFVCCFSRLCNADGGVSAGRRAAALFVLHEVTRQLPGELGGAAVAGLVRRAARWTRASWSPDDDSAAELDEVLVLQILLDLFHELQADEECQPAVAHAIYYWAKRCDAEEVGIEG